MNITQKRPSLKIDTSETFPPKRLLIFIKQTSSQNNISSVSYPDLINFPPVTPKKIDYNQTLDCVFPRSLAEKDYPQDIQTRLRSYSVSHENPIYFVYHQDLAIQGNLTGYNSPKLVKLSNNDEYIYKKSYILAEYLPEDHSRTIIGQKYHSHSRVMMQIMSRNLLELLLKNEKDIILPQMYPVVDNTTGEICGLISQKIECDDYNSLGEKLKIKQLSKEVIEDTVKLIDKKSKSIGLPTLAKIIGIDDLIYPFAELKVKNIGITPEGKLVLFDFGVNLLDFEEDRHLLLKPDDNYESIIFKTNNDKIQKKLKQTTDAYLKDYNTVQNGFEDDGTAKTVHPDIENIIITTGPSDTEFRTKLAKLMQARINNAILQAEKMTLST